MSNFPFSRSFNLLGALTLTILFASCGHAPKSTDDGNARFSKFREFFVEQMWKVDPSSAIYAGFHNYDSILPLNDEKTRNEQVAVLRTLLDSLKTFDEKSLSANDRIDLWMMRDKAEGSIWYLINYKSYEWNPATYNVAGEFAEILNGTYAPLNDRLKMFNLRLQKVGEYYAVARAQISKPTVEHTDLAILQNEGSVEEVFGKNLEDSVGASGLDAATKEQLLAGAKAAKTAMLDYATWLKELRKGLTPENSRSFRLGGSLYEKKFEYDICAGKTAREMYDIAVARKSEIHHEMASIARSLWPKYFGAKPMPADSISMIRQMIDTLSVVHVHRDSFMQAIEQQIPALIAFINQKNLIYIDPSKPLVVRRTPAYMEGGGAGASISAPGPYDKNGKTFYNVSPLTGYSPEEAESYLREYNKYILQILNIHEAIPGHYTQLVYSNNSPSIIKSLLGNGAMVEGWAVYSERMMLENGYGNNEPEMWLMYYKWHLRSVCNTILDYSVHVLNMSKEDALKLLIDGDFQQQAEAEGKWRRVTLTQVQLTSYFTGFSQIYQLREELKKKEGAAFNLKKFHESFLNYGSAPVKYTSELMLHPNKD